MTEQRAETILQFFENTSSYISNLIQELVAENHTLRACNERQAALLLEQERALSRYRRGEEVT